MRKRRASSKSCMGLKSGLGQQACARKPMADKALGTRLRPYRKSVRVGPRQYLDMKEYYLRAAPGQLSRGLCRHPPFQSATTATNVCKKQRKARIWTRHKFRNLLRIENAWKPRKTGFVAGVADENGEEPSPRCGGMRAAESAVPSPSQVDRRTMKHTCRQSRGQLRRTAWRRRLRPPQRNRRRPCSGGSGECAAIGLVESSQGG